MSDADRDRLCVGRIAAGDAAALEELYDQHCDLLYSLAARITGRAELAEDVLQETWIQVWRNARAYDSSRGSVGAWLVTLTRSRAIDRLRSEGSRLRAETAAALDPPASPPDVSVEAAHRQLSERAVTALQKLEAQHRQVLELAYFEGLSQSEIADRLRAPLGTIKSWTRQALLRLSELVPREEAP
jgi:RNA polymerase sigma-70 factor (ECF subfamily)